MTDDLALVRKAAAVGSSTSGTILQTLKLLPAGDRRGERLLEIARATMAEVASRAEDHVFTDEDATRSCDSW